MQLRIDRNFELTVDVRGGRVTIKPPIRISFDATKSTSGGLNKATVQIYNLKESNRLALAKDIEQRKIIASSLKVGYQNRLELLFKGNVHTGKNEKQGADMVTTLEILDGGSAFLDSFTSKTIKGSKEAIKATLSDMTGIKEGTLNERPVLTRPKVLVGNSARLLSDMLDPDEEWYIEDEKLYFLKDQEVISRYIPKVNASTGLISTPTRKNKEVTFKTLMNPTIKIGRRVELESKTAPYMNGIYKIWTVNFAGDNYGDEWSQTCTGKLDQDLKVI